MTTTAATSRDHRFTSRRHERLDPSTAPLQLLVAYDGSPAAEAAIAAAGRLFDGALGQLLMVVESPPGYDRLRRAAFALDSAGVQHELEVLFREVTERRRDIAHRGLQLSKAVGLRLEPQVLARQGGESERILSQAETAQTDLIVVGSRGRGALARSLLGSTSTEVLHRAARPVLVVPAEPAETDGPALIAYDGSPSARAAVHAAGHLLAGRDVTITHIWSSPVPITLSGRAVARDSLDAAKFRYAAREAAAAVVDEGVALALEIGLQATGKSINSALGTWPAIAKAAHDQHATAIVTGSRGRGGLASAILGSVSAGLVRNAARPVLIVRASPLS